MLQIKAQLGLPPPCSVNLSIKTFEGHRGGEGEGLIHSMPTPCRPVTRSMTNTSSMAARYAKVDAAIPGCCKTLLPVVSPSRRGVKRSLASVYEPSTTMQSLIGCERSPDDAAESRPQEARDAIALSTCARENAGKPRNVLGGASIIRDTWQHVPT